MSTGMVLEGGAMRGMFTAGVLDVMMENDIKVDGYVGVSAGVTFGCNYKSRQIGRAIRYNKRYGRDWRYCSAASLILTGDLYGARFCYETIPYSLDPFDLKTFRSNPVRFYAVMTDVETGGPVYAELKEGSGIDMLYIRASASMPLVSKPVEIMGRKYLDGGMSDSIPLRFMQKKGYDKNVVVLTQPPGFVKPPVSNMKLIRMILRKYPGAVKAMAKRHLVYNKELALVEESVKNGSAFVIQPSESLGISHTESDPDVLQRVYDIGRRTMEAKLSGLKEFLS